MAGYSGTPLPKKLGIRSGHRVALVHAPDGFALEGTGDDVLLQEGLRGSEPLDVILFFTSRRAQLERELAMLRKRMTPAAGLWIAWPKKASGVPSDMTEDVVRAVCLPTGLVDNKVCAIDDTWSGLRLVIRLEHRK